jgi:adenosylcobinamide kinase / adenosylcobinamide-phosphate guanylyltransferase
MNRIILVGGGVRSGKSRWALERALALGERRLFVATARRWDAEMVTRIERHQVDRQGFGDTLEEHVELATLLSTGAVPEVVLIDCLSHWVTNLLSLGDDEALLARFDALVAALALRRAHVVMVSNEVGMSLHAETPVGRRFQTLTGFLHQRLSRVADEVHLAVMGMVVPLKPWKEP